MAESRSFAGILIELTYLVGRVLADGCREYDPTPQRARLLCLLDDGPMTMGSLSPRLMLERSSLTGPVDRGVKRGLLRRVDSAHDRRARQVAFTIDGARAQLLTLMTRIVTASHKTTAPA